MVDVGEQSLRLDDGVMNARPDLVRFEGRRLILGIRPEDLEDAALVSGTPPDRRIAATVDIVEDLGSEMLVHFGVQAPPVRGQDVEAAVGHEALEATEEAARKKGTLFVARLDRASRARAGERIEVAVKTGRMHFFDPETGLGIYDGRDG
jgi:multiple sugar transport system ATP-binding protein